MWLLALVGTSQADENFMNLAYVGDGSTISGNQLLEASIRAAQNPRAAASYTERGAASYAIPIPTPATRHSPSVSLGYTSEGTEHSWIARGWSLDHGFPTITRMRGVEATQAYGDVDSPFRVAGGGFSGVLYRHPTTGDWTYGGTSDTTEMAIVWSTEGVELRRAGTTTYLEARNDVTYGPEGPATYRPVRSVDAFGNEVVLEWSGDRLDAIRYGGWCATSGFVSCAPTGADAHLIEVQFEYAQRDDVSLDARGGFVDTRAEVLVAIEVLSKDTGEMLRRHELFYDQAQTGRGRLLTSVEVVGTGVDQTPLREAVAWMSYTEWDDGDVYHDPDAGPTSLSYRELGRPRWAPNRYWDTLGREMSGVWDLTGDGFVELYRTEFQTVEYLSRAEGSTDVADVGFAPRQRDLGALGEPTVLADHLVPETLTVLCAQDSKVRYTTVMYVDVDGDGIVDRVAATKEPQRLNGTELGSPPDYCWVNEHGEEWNQPGVEDTWQISWGRDGGFESPVPRSTPVPFPQVGGVIEMSPGDQRPDDLPVGLQLLDGTVDLIDMNGDGWRDIVQIDDDVSGSAVVVWLKTPGRDQGWAQTPVVWYNGADFQGISKSVTWNTVHEEEYNGFIFATGEAIESYTVSGFRDLNGDGLEDYVVACPGVDYPGDITAYWWCGSKRADATHGQPAPDTWRVYLNNGHGFAAPRMWSLPTTEGAELWRTNNDPARVRRSQVATLTRVDEGRTLREHCSFSNVPSDWGLWPLDRQDFEGLLDEVTSHPTMIGDWVEGQTSTSPPQLNVPFAGEQGEYGITFGQCEVLPIWFGGVVTSDDSLDPFDTDGPPMQPNLQTDPKPGRGRLGGGTCKDLQAFLDTEDPGAEDQNRPGEAEWGDTQKVLATLLDYDADGRPDFVDFEYGVWYRNTGDGFAEGLPLPDWMPRAQTESIAVQVVMSWPDMAFALDGFPAATATDAFSHELYRVADLDGNGLLDLVAPVDFVEVHGNNRTQVVDGGLHLGQRVRPGLLQAVEVPAGAQTALDYTPSSYMDPSGVDDYLSGAVPPHLDKPGRMLVTAVEVYDPHTGEGARQSIQYANGICDGGVCQGYEDRVVDTFKRSDRFGSLPGNEVHLSRLTTTALLDRDYSFTDFTELETDVALAHVPDHVGPEALAPLLTTVQTLTLANAGVGKVTSARLKKRTHTERAPDGPGARTWSVQAWYNATGHVTRVFHDAPGTTDDVNLYTSWKASSDGSVVAPTKQYTKAYDHGSATVKTVEQALFAYDGGALQGAPSDGVLTWQRVLAGLPTSLTATRLDWTFQRSPRGALSHVLGVDSGAGTFQDVTYSDFAFGHTLARVETNALGHQTWRDVDAFGRVIEESDANGVTTRRQLDSLDRSVRETLQGASGPEWLVAERTFHVTASPQIVEEKQHAYEVNGDPRSVVAFEVLDGFGDPMLTYSPHLNGEWVVKDSYRDAFGNTIAESVPHGEDADPTIFGPMFTSTMAVESWYDAMGVVRHVESLSAPQALTTLLTAPGVAETFDGMSYTKITHTDTHGRMVRVDEGRSSSIATTGTYAYDGKGRVARFEDANGNAWGYTWDGAGRLRQVDRAPNGGSASPYRYYTYSGPWLDTENDGNGDKDVQWVRDALGRPIQKDVRELTPSAGLRWRAYTWTWDDRPGTSWVGALVQSTDPAGVTLYEFDGSSPWGDFGRQTGVERQNTGHAPLAFSTGYDFEGRAVSSSWPSGAKLASTYDPSGVKLSDTLDVNGDTQDILYGYNTLGQLDRWSTQALTARLYRANAAKISRTELVTPFATHAIDYGYTDNGWLRTKVITGVTGPGQEVVYDYDAFGRIGSVSLSSGPGSTPVGLEAFTYDNAGNMLAHGHMQGTKWVDWAYDPTTRFSEVPGRSTDTIDEVVDQHTWDPLTSRLTSWTRHRNGALEHDRDFGYDGHGRLVEIDSTDGLTELYYDVDDNVVYEERGGFDVYQRFGGFRSSPSEWVEAVLPHVRVVTDTSSGAQEIRFALHDADGAGMWTVDASGNLVNQEVRGPYGVPMGDGSWSLGSPWDLDGLHGSETDRTNDVVHHGRRHTLFRDGMWMQPEPLLLAGSLRLTGQPRSPGSTYAAGNPLAWHDISGFTQQPAQPSMAAQAAEIAWDVNSGMARGLLNAGADFVFRVHHPVQAANRDAEATVALAQALYSDFWGTLNNMGTATTDRLKADPVATLVETAVGAFISGAAGGQAMAGIRIPGRPGACFPAGTEVVTPAGSLPIQDLRVGDLVVARDVGRDA
ncbi:MAG: hypothetical protein H6734_15135, partial [Alphaproteobacteria bacterium]|nr:hypothetical protein [Alphaproteobacteria bacterium]